ncbi:MAG: hypothetical protein JXA41_12135, partial [Deltaproteobacteria bacterium]|nr:hypothetical protein [Deltaproteobacteria bacterium]
MTHPRLTDASPDQLHWDVNASRKILENIFQKPVFAACYPFNDFKDGVEDAVRAAGYLWARGSDHQDPVSSPLDPVAFSPHCRFDDGDIMEKYDRAKQTGNGIGIVWDWGWTKMPIPLIPACDSEGIRHGVPKDVTTLFRI